MNSSVVTGLSERIYDTMVVFSMIPVTECRAIPLLREMWVLGSTQHQIVFLS